LFTTVTTNALLERKGRKHALLITKGFKDLLLIGNQSRPKIFDLNIRRPPPLYSTVLEIDERVTLVGYTSDPQAEEHKVLFEENGVIKRGYRGMGWDGKGEAESPGKVVRGISGEAVRILKQPSSFFLPLLSACSLTHPQIGEASVKKDLQQLYDDGYRSVAVVLAHSYTFPEHELLVGKVASDLGFEHISLSSQLLPMIKMVPRGASATADAYLTPILRSYLDGFFAGFAQPPCVEFMSSDGGLVDVSGFSGLKTVLSGPAGGVVGYARTSWDKKRKTPIIGSVFVSIDPFSSLSARQTRRGWHVYRCVTLLGSLRDRLRNDHRWGHDPVTTARYQHCRCWWWLVSHLSQWFVPSRARKCRSRAWSNLLPVSRPVADSFESRTNDPILERVVLWP
jgi:5-oxoprolinase (ATP-hydrolysing)